MRKIVAILLVVTILSSVFMEQAQAITIRFTGKWYKPWTWDVHIEITAEQIADLLKKGLDYLGKLFKLKVKIPKAAAFHDVVMKLSGWVYATDGESYLDLTAPASINTPGEYYICDFGSAYDATNDYNQFTWEAYGTNGILADSGNVGFMIDGGGITLSGDKLGLLAPYIGYVSTILVTTVAVALSLKRVRSRKEKQ